MLCAQNCKYKTTSFLYDLIPPVQRSLWNKDCIYEPFCQILPFKKFFFTVHNKTIE